MEAAYDLTIYLIKKNLGIDEVLAANAASTAHRLHEKSDIPGQLYLAPSNPAPPGWSSFFKSHIDPSELGISSSPAAVYFVEAAGRLFALTFGNGRFMLRLDCVEERFGLITVLNSATSDALRSIDRRTFGSTPRNSREQTLKEADISQFGLDVEQDLLRGITAKPTDQKLGSRLTGSDSLHAHVTTSLDRLDDLLAKYLEVYQNERYKNEFPWVDHLAEVKNRDTISSLDAALIKNINDAWLAPPDIIDWERPCHFRYGRRIRDPLHNELRLLDFTSYIGTETLITPQLLRDRFVDCVSEGQIVHTWSIYSCINAELVVDGETYILSAGKWFRIHQDLVAVVNGYIDNIPESRVPFPPYKHSSEADYNKSLADKDPSYYTCLDAKTILFGGGRSKFELCDIFTVDKEFIHIKKYAGSSPLSHLFAQGVASAELFRTERLFRDLAHRKLPQSHVAVFDPANEPTNNEYTVTYAIIKDPSSSRGIPFFSKLNLRNAAKRLRSYGYQVAMSYIPVDYNHALTKRYLSSKRRKTRRPAAGTA